MCFIFSFPKKTIQISLKSGVFSPWWNLDREKLYFRGYPADIHWQWSMGPRAEEGRLGTLISFGMQTASPVPCMSSSVAEGWVKVALVTPAWGMSPYWHTDLYKELWEQKRRGSRKDRALLRNQIALSKDKKHVFSVLNHTAQHRLKKTKELCINSPIKTNHSWYRKIYWMRLHGSITSFMKITLNNYEVTSRMRSLIGVAEFILQKSITIQISTFQSHSIATRTLQTLKVFSLAAGEGSNYSLSGSILCFFDLVGQVWKRAWRFCRLCAASLSTREQGFVL